MNKNKASLMSEATLWQLYHKLVVGRALQQHLPRPASSASIAVAAALAANTHPGDTLGLPSSDLLTRYLCGLPLKTIHAAATSRHRFSTSGANAYAWPLQADAEHGILPGNTATQAALAVGTALAARLHATENVTVLVQPAPPPSSTGPAPQTPLPAWSQAAAIAVALQLPLLFVTESRTGLHHHATSPSAPASALPAISVDRADALALYRVLYESSARARAGGGPTWIDCRDWALDTKHRRHSSRSAPPTADAVLLLEQALRSRDLFDRDRLRHIERNLAKEFAHAGFSAHRAT